MLKFSMFLLVFAYDVSFDLMGLDSCLEDYMNRYFLHFISYF